MLEEFLRREFGSVVASLFDPAPVQFTARDEQGVGPTRRACMATDDGISPLRRPLNRNAFLCGCLDFTEDELVEHLLVGFGTKRGSTTKVSEIAHVLGQAARVNFPPWLQSRLADWLSKDHEAEVVIFHNHPPNVLNAAVDNSPLASSTDRRTLLGQYLQPLIALKGLTGGGRVRYYLGENGFVREFRTPDAVAFLAMLERARGTERRS